jgi:1-acyl-sn-glycerol-3-phosphate acyltransferase
MVTITPPPKHQLPAAESKDIGSIDLPPPFIGPSSSNRQRRQQQIRWGFLAFQMTGTVVVGILISVVVLLWHHPWSFGCGVVVPYYYFCFFVSADGGGRRTRRRRPGLRPELDHGAPWRSFSASFPPLQWMRQFLQLSLQDGTSSSSSSSSKRKDAGPIFSSTEQQYIFAVFPHGIHGEFRVLMDGRLQDSVVPPERVDHTRTLAASILFKIPLVREIVLWTGCVDASVAVADRLLRDNFNLIVLPGGQQEQIRTQYGVEQVYVMRRQGFVRLALRHQVPVVPAYVFGSVDAYRTLRMSPWGWTVRQFLLKNVGVALPPLYWGYRGSICCPNPVKTTVVFGSPLYLHDEIRPGSSAPTTAATNNSDDVNEAHVDAAHAVFVEALVKLFDENKGRLGYGDRTLRVL